MSDGQLSGLYDIARTSEGYPKFPEIEGDGKQLTAREMFNRRCYLLGINEPEIREQLWLKLRAGMGYDKQPSASDAVSP